MVPGIKHGNAQRGARARGSRHGMDRILFEIVVAMLAVGVFSLKIANYADPAVSSSYPLSVTTIATATR